MVVGRHPGADAIAAISTTSSLYSLIVNFVIGLNSGYGVVVTQHFGIYSEKNMKQAIAGKMILNVIVTVLLTILALIILRPLMGFMNTLEAIFLQAHTYIAIVYGAWFSLLPIICLRQSFGRLAIADPCCIFASFPVS